MKQNDDDSRASASDIDDAFLWLLEQHDSDQPVGETVLANRFGADAVARAMERWHEYLAAEKAIRGAFQAGQSVAVHAVDKEKSTDRDQSLADTESFLASTKPQLPPDKHRLQLPVSIGKFNLAKELGHGAFGSVYLAEDTKLQRQVAVKIPHRNRLNDRSNLERFFREARAAANLDHPSIVPVYEVGQIDGHCFIAAQFIQGKSLRHFLHSNKDITPRRAAEIIGQLAEALNHAHTHGIIHRDVKPENVMMDEEGHPRLMDFGLAQRREGETLQTQEGVQMGTPSYMSPEQAKGQSHLADARSDMWALGVMLYEMLTGERPFDGGDTLETLRNVVEGETPAIRRSNPKIARDLETICLKCLEKNPERRYATCQHLAEDLHRYVEGLPTSARPISHIERVVRWCRRRPLRAAVITIGIVFVASALIYRGTRPAYLDLRVSPADAIVTIDGTKLLLEKGQILYPSTPGPHALSMSATGHATVTKEVNLLRGRDKAFLESIKLPSIFGRAQIESNPSGAAVTLLTQDDQVVARGTTPILSPRLSAGEYTAAFEKPLFQPTRLTISIPGNDRVATPDSVTLAPSVDGAGSFAILEQSRQVLNTWLGEPLVFENTPLKDFAKEIGRKAGVPIVVSTRYVRRSPSSTPTITQSHNGISLRDLLVIALHGIDCIYSIDYSDEKLIIQIIPERQSGNFIQRVMFPMDAVLSEDASELEYSRLIAAIHASVRPDQWNVRGGPSIVRAIPKSRAIVVVAPSDVLSQVHSYLADLVSLKQSQAIAGDEQLDLGEPIRESEQG